MRVWLFVAVVTATSATPLVEAVAQVQAPPPVRQAPSSQRERNAGSGEEKTVQGVVRSIDASEKEITLTNGTRLVVSPDAELKPGLLRKGTTVIANYKEEGGKNVLTAVVVVAPPPLSSPPPSGGTQKR